MMLLTGIYIDYEPQYGRCSTTSCSKDYQGHVTNVEAQYNVGLVASSDVLAAKTNLDDSQTSLVKAQNAANLAEANLNQVIAYPCTNSYYYSRA